VRQRLQRLRGAAQLFFYAIAMLVLIVTSRAGLADELLSPEEFTRAFIAKAETVVRDRTFTMAEPLKVIATAKNGDADDTKQLFLDNVYRSYRSNPNDLEGILRNHIAAVLSHDNASPTLSREQLLPVVRHRDYASAAVSGDKVKLAVEAFAHDMLIFYMFDQPEISVFARMEEVEKLGLDPSELRAVSLSNLRRNLPEPPLDANASFAIINGGGPYVTGLLFVDEYWTKERFPYRGDMVVFVIGREVMLVTGSEEREVVQYLRGEATKLVAELPYAISDQPVIRCNGRWEAY
jgi:hypothetical protein